MQPSAAIDILVDYSRLVSGGDLNAHDVLGRLVRTVREHDLVDAAVAVEVSASGQAVAVAARGVDLHGPLDIDGLGQELEQRVLGLRPDCDHVYTLPLVSSGGLFGAVVLLWNGLRPDGTGLKLVEGLVDITAVALDRAYQTQHLQEALVELEHSQEALARREKLEALGQMAAIVAHEVKNPLASVSGALQVLSTRMSGAPDDARIIDLILQRTRGLARMVDELLVFARPRPPTLSRIRLDFLLQGPAELFRADTRFAEVELTVRADPPDLTLLADAAMLQPVLFNLLLNAAQAMESMSGPRITVTGGRRNGAVEIVVQDTGPGIPADKAETIFEPFFTTKTRGSGLGLAIAAQVVDAHGGTIRLDTEAEQGARFVLCFPQAAKIGG